MKPSLLDILVDPDHHKPLTFHQEHGDDNEIISGQLQAEDGTIYRVHDGIPRFVKTDDSNQQQTSDTFAFKWGMRATYNSLAYKQNAIHWSLEKYGFDTLETWVAYFNSRQSILDIGCGSGFSSSLWLDTPEWQGDAPWVGVDISEAIDVAQEHLSHIQNTHFIQADALHLPFPDNSFDTIFSEGVLHHTPSTRDALLSLTRVLAHGGECHFYVYRKKAPVREFTDDYIREQIAPLSNEAAWNAMRSLTQLGRDLAELHTTVTISQDVPLLGIKAGSYDIQRLFYWHFAKLFWNDTLSFEENVHVNFDWYRPYYAHRHTAEEIHTWCAEADLNIHWFHDQESGFTVRATKA